MLFVWLFWIGGYAAIVAMLLVVAVALMTETICGTFDSDDD